MIMKELRSLSLGIGTQPIRTNNHQRSDFRLRDDQRAKCTTVRSDSGDSQCSSKVGGDSSGSNDLGLDPGFGSERDDTNTDGNSCASGAEPTEEEVAAYHEWVAKRGQRGPTPDPRRTAASAETPRKRGRRGGKKRAGNKASTPRKNIC